MEALTPWHLLLILVGFVVLFGYKKLPDASRSLGRSLRIFKTEMRAMNGDGPSDGKDGATPEESASAAEAHSSSAAEAAAAEARAVELRERARASAARRDPAS